MNLRIATVLAATALASTAFADGHTVITGDMEAGEKAYNKCKSCHMIQDADGTDVVKGGRTGPNLYGVVGRQAGTYDGYRYGKSIVEAGEQGLVWTEETFTAYVADPKGFLQEYLDDSKARAKMSFRLKKGAEDIYAYLASVGPAAE